MIRINPDERILLLKRRHIFVLIKKLFSWVFLFGISFLGLLVAKHFFPFPSLITLVILILMHLLWIFLFISVADYYLDTWIITDERVLDLELKGLFNREFSEFKLNKIQDATVEVEGVLPTFLDYGDLHIQTAGEMREFIFKDIPDPDTVKNSLLKAHDKFIEEGEIKKSDLV